MTANRAPQAFILDEENGEAHIINRKSAKLEFEPEPADTAIAIVPAAPVPASRRFRWGAVLLSALTALITLWAGLTITQMIESFFATSPWLGWLATATAAIAAIAALAIILREVWGIWSLRRIEHIQLTSAHARNFKDRKSSTEAFEAITALYHARPDAAEALRAFNQHRDDVMNPEDRLTLAERLLIAPRDEQARKVIARRARRVTLLTTVTPAAALDILFVAAQNFAMLREIATLYGGRPATLSTLRLGRMVLAHLAIAGGLALSDNMLQHLVGRGLLGKLSARFGEGAVNGILTTRIGMAACNLCRPIPRSTEDRETILSMVRELLNFSDAGKS